MLDLFTIFSKGGIVLWCVQSTSQIFTPSVNALIKNVILQVSITNICFIHLFLTIFIYLPRFSTVFLFTLFKIN